jgi:hypothetical protein
MVEGTAVQQPLQPHIEAIETAEQPLPAPMDQDEVVVVHMEDEAVAAADASKATNPMEDGEAVGDTAEPMEDDEEEQGGHGSGGAQREIGGTHARMGAGCVRSISPSCGRHGRKWRGSMCISLDNVCIS